jgi:hypothetical protein
MLKEKKKCNLTVITISLYKLIKKIRADNTLAIYITDTAGVKAFYITPNGLIYIRLRIKVRRPS